MGTTFQTKTEKSKITLIAILTATACFFTYYFHVKLGIGTVFTHFYYIPIILACIWWQRRGLVVAAFLSAFLIFSHIFLRLYVLTLNDYLRAVMFVLIGFVVVILTESSRFARRALRSRLVIRMKKHSTNST